MQMARTFSTGTLADAATITSPSSGRARAIPLRQASFALQRSAALTSGWQRSRQPQLSCCSTNGPLPAPGGDGKEEERNRLGAQGANGGSPDQAPQAPSTSAGQPSQHGANAPPQGWVRASLGGWSQNHNPGRLPQAGASSSLDDAWADFSADSWVPAPSNLPTNGGVDEDDSVGSHNLGDAIYARRTNEPAPGAGISSKDLWTVTDQPGVDLFLAGPRAWGRIPQVYVILFGVGERDTEGIYSLRAFGSDGVPHETIIAFESEDDALRYAGLLEASMDHTPNVCSIPPRELLNFCLDQGYSCRLEPTGTLLIPPDFNVGVTDWERSIRLREGKFSVLEDEPEHQQRSAAQPSTSTATAPSPLANLEVRPGLNSSTLARFSQVFTGDDLDAIKARLEALLPKD